jgi:ADP-dependent NAD(P)H-hydrate dehydratase
MIGQNDRRRPGMCVQITVWDPGTRRLVLGLGPLLLFEVPMSDATKLPEWPPRPADANKGTFGRAVLFAGSRGMSGAAQLSGLACLRGGAGLVRVAVPRGIQPLVALASPALMTAALPEDDDGRFADDALAEWLRLAEANDVVALGPGLGRSPTLDGIVPTFLTSVDRPMVVDADGLNALNEKTLSAHRGPVVLTPHPGEFGRLVKLPVAEVQARRGELASAFAKRTGCIVLLKGQHTIVTDGDRVHVNATGNPGMAIPGAGDVLTGLITALIAQKFTLFDAARLGAHLHGMAGDLVRDRQGEIGILATDLVEALPLAIRRFRTAPSP